MSEPTAAPISPSLRIHFAVFAGTSIFIWLMLINDDWPDPYAHFIIADRIVRGQIPFRDFFMFFLPASVYSLAAWFKLFGYSIGGLRVLMALCGGTTVTTAFHISCMVISGPLRWVGAAGVLAAFIVGNEGLSHMSFSVPIALIAVALAIHASRQQSDRLWFLSAFSAAFSGLFTQTIGAWLGLAVLLSSILSVNSARKRIANAVLVAAAGCAALLPMLFCIYYWNAWASFYYNFFIWPLERYAPYHAGVGWGAWLPSWSMLNQIPVVWRAVWIPALTVVWSAVFLFPALLVYSAARAMIARNLRGNCILWLAAAGFLASAFPHAGAMRLVRLTLPLWILAAFELERLVTRSQGVNRHNILSVGRHDGGGIASPQAHRTMNQNLLSVLLAIFLLSATGLQWSYRGQLVQLNTPRGNVLVHPQARDEYEALKRHLSSGTSVLSIPDAGPTGYLLDLHNPTGYDMLLPVLFSPAQLNDAARQLREKSFPPIVFLDHLEARQEWIAATFKPSKYLDEFNSNPFNKFLHDNYTVEFHDGAVTGLVKIQKNEQ